jgi:hypothetical protein
MLSWRRILGWSGGRPQFHPKPFIRFHSAFGMGTIHRRFANGDAELARDAGTSRDGGSRVIPNTVRSDAAVPSTALRNTKSVLQATPTAPGTDPMQKQSMIDVLEPVVAAYMPSAVGLESEDDIVDNWITEYRRVSLKYCMSRAWNTIANTKYPPAVLAGAMINRWADEVAYHETKIQNIPQGHGGPGRGYFQFELDTLPGKGGNKLAVNHARKWYLSQNEDPVWLKAMVGVNVDFTTIRSYHQQKILFFFDKVYEPGAHLDTIVATSIRWPEGHDDVFYGEWKTGHWKGSTNPDPWRGDQFHTVLKVPQT